MESGGIIAITFIPLVLLYFLPTYVAYRRKHNNVLPIFLVNLLLGGLYGIGWVIALIWACSDNVAKKKESSASVSKLIKCPDCEKEVSPSAPACPNCGRPMKTAE